MVFSKASKCKPIAFESATNFFFDFKKILLSFDSDNFIEPPFLFAKMFKVLEMYLIVAKERKCLMLSVLPTLKI